MAQFIQGLELSRLYYLEAVKPILDAHFPDLRYDAALICTDHDKVDYAALVDGSRLVIDSRNATKAVKTHRDRIVLA